MSINSRESALRSLISSLLSYCNPSLSRVFALSNFSFFIQPSATSTVSQQYPSKIQFPYSMPSACIVGSWVQSGTAGDEWEVKEALAIGRDSIGDYLRPEFESLRDTVRTL